MSSEEGPFLSIFGPTITPQIFMTNARSGEGVEDVKNWLVEQMPLGPPFYPKGSISYQSERFFISEIVREHIFLRYEQEIPYR